MENNFLTNLTSFSIWPSSKNLANEIGIPIIIEYRPFEEEMQLMDLSEKCTNLSKCSYCSAYVTSVFIFSKDKISQCPYCGNDFLLPKSISFLPYQNFKVEKKIERFSFYLCFIIDLDCSQDNFINTKYNFSVALKALLPDTFFIVALIKNNRFHFIMVFNNNSKIISFDVTSSLFNRITLKSFVNNVKSVDYINEYVQNNLSSSNVDQLHEIIDFSALFSQCPDDIFIKFILFTPNHVSESCSSHLSFDIISPVLNNHAKNIDGFYLNSQEVPNVDFQIQSMIQRYRTSSFAINLSTQIYYNRQFEISPSPTLTKSSIHCGSSFLFTVSFPRLFGTLKEVHLQFVSKYIIISPSVDNSELNNNSGYNCEMKVTSRIQVNSYIYTTSKDIVPILRTFNPVILKKSLQSKVKEKNFIKKLFELYKEKVTDNLVGSINSNSFFDPYFLIMPNFQLFLKFYLTENKYLNSTFITEKELEFVQFCPSVSFWHNQDQKIEEMPISFVESDEIFHVTPIVVIDSCTKIEIYMDDPKLQINSKLSKEIEKKIKMRFPVPIISKKVREALVLNINEMNEKFNESLKLNFESIFKI